LYRHLVLCIGYIVKGGFPLEVDYYSLTIYHYQGGVTSSFYSYTIFGVWFITFGFRAYDPRVFLLQMSHLGIFTIIFFGKFQIVKFSGD
jgi:hypothetical protein